MGVHGGRGHGIQAIAEGSQYQRCADVAGMHGVVAVANYLRC